MSCPSRRASCRCVKSFVSHASRRLAQESRTSSKGMAASTSLKRHATDIPRSARKNQLQAETQLIRSRWPAHVTGYRDRWLRPTHSQFPHPRFGCNRQNKSPKNGYVPLQLASKQASNLPPQRRHCCDPNSGDGGDHAALLQCTALKLAWRPLGAPTDPYDRCAYWSTRVRLFRYLCVSTN